MKKTFLKSVAAAAVVTVAVALSSVAAFAGEYLWIYEDEPTAMPAIMGLDSQIDLSLSTNMSTSRTATFSTPIFNNGESAAIAGHNGFNFRDNGSDSNSVMYRSFVVTPTADVDLALYLARTSSTDGGEVRFYELTKNEDGTYTRPSDPTSTFAPGGNATTGISPMEVSLTAGHTYSFYANNSNIGLFAMNISSAADITTNTKYDLSLFGDETTGNTVIVPGTTVKKSATVEEWVAAVGIDPTAAESGTINANANATINGFNFVSPSTRTFRYNYANATIQTNGSSNSNGRYIEFTAEAGDCLKVLSLRSQNNTDTSRYVTLLSAPNTPSSFDAGINSAYAPTEYADIILSIPSAGTYYLCASNGIEFKGIELIAGESVPAPTISLSNADTTTYAGKVAYTATIAGNADDSVVVTGINFVVAKGYSDTKLNASSYEITGVYNNGSDYIFVVTIDASKVSALPGLKTQANVVTEAGTLYSAVVEYIPAV